MPTDIMTALPAPSHRFTRRMRRHTFRRLQVYSLLPDNLALAAREHEATVNERGAEEPLCDSSPDGRDEQVAHDGAQATRRDHRPQRWAQTAVRDYEQAECDRDPDPADLDKVNVEDVAFARKVGRGLRGWVRLQVGAVGRVSGRGGEDAEEGPEEEGQGVDREKGSFEGSGEEG